MKFVIDMMGGDNGLKATIPSMQEFIKKYSDVEYFLVGDINKLSKFNNLKNVHLVASETVLPMDADPLTALKETTSSLMISIKTFLENKCDALISAGSTGALLSASIFKIKRLPNITRPCLITSFPTVKSNKKFVVCDLGANAANTKEELNQFAIMGSLYYSIIYDEKNPRVYLLNNGTEEEKGNDLTKEAYALLSSNKSINFKGNIEAREPLFGDVDVLVTDGFTGNVFLKSVEGTAKAMSSMIKEAFKKNIFTMIGYLFSKSGINGIKNKMDYKNVGGALLLGVNGVVIKAHGSSDARSFSSALLNAYKLTKVDIVNKIKKELE